MKKKKIIYFILKFNHFIVLSFYHYLSFQKKKIKMVKNTNFFDEK